MGRDVLPSLGLPGGGISPFSLCLQARSASGHNERHARTDLPGPGPGVCEDDTDCPVGYECKDDGEACVKMPDLCTIDSDCESGEECRDGACVLETCSDDNDCPADYECRGDDGCVKIPDSCTID